MNDKITFPRLATLLSDKSGRSKRFSEDFLREFFALISERLEAGESVKVKGLGTFRLSRVEPRRSVDVTTGQPMEISGHTKVVFIPAKELADAVNAPFEAFTAIEISDNADISQLFSQDEIDLNDPSEDSNEDADASIVQTVFHAEEETATDGFPKEEANKASGQTEDTNTEETETDGYRDNEAYTAGLREEDATDVVSEKKETALPIPAEEDEVKAQLPEANDGDLAEKVLIPEESGEENEGTAEDPVAQDENNASDEEEESQTWEEESKPRKTWVRTLLISLGAAMIALIATFAVWYVFATHDFNRFFSRTASNTQASPQDGFVVGNKEATEAQAIDLLPQDNVSDSMTEAEEEIVPTAPSDPIVYDTISTTRFLTTMAKAHYGNFNLWPFIYEENKAILGHPDRIRPGTPVVIPKLSKYGIDALNKDDVEKAKKMGVEIYARYGKKI